MLASPAAAGALLTFAPLQIILFIDVVTAIIGISILFFLVKVPEKTAEEKAEAAARGYLRGMKEGVSYIGQHKFIKLFFVCAASYSILLAPAALLTPLQVTRDFGSDVWRLTAIELVFSLGMLVGGIIISAWGGFKNKTVTLAIGSLLFGVEGIGLGVLTNFPLYLVCMAVMGFTVPVINTPVMAILQAKVDPDYMGRVFGVMTMVTSIGMPAGMVLFGPLGDVIAIDYLLIATGIGTLFLGLYVFLSRTLMEAGR
jgi:DHA3 family macrolide efflux protein-like MFS transporter